MTLNGVAAVVVSLLFISLFFAVQKPSPSVDGYISIAQTAPDIVLWKGPDAAQSTVAIVEKSTGAVLAELRRDRDGGLRQDPNATQRYTVEARETPIIGFAERGDQLGTFVGYFNQKEKRVDRFQIGIHYEPVTLFFGTIGAPSLALTKDLAGLGITARLPPRYFPRLSCIGAGIWEVAPFNGGHPGLLFGAEFHITLP